MKKSIIDESLKELEDSYDAILNNINGIRFKTGCKENILLSLDTNILYKVFKGMLRLDSLDKKMIYDRIKYMPGDYIRFIKIMNKIIIEVSLGQIMNFKHFKTINKIIIYGDLSYGFICDDEEFRCEKRISFTEFIIFQSIMIEMLSIGGCNLFSSTLTSDEFDMVSKMVNTYIELICDDEKNKCNKNIFKKIFISARNKFRYNIRYFCDEYIDFN